MDIRHQQRIKIIQNLYAYSFCKKEDKFLNRFDKKTLAVIKNEKQINDYISQFALKFPIDKIAKIDLAILQLSIYELVIEKKEPAKVIIDEAVELAKELGAERSFAFINAILGKVYKKIYGNAV